jgi:hypothetical protein
MSTSWFFSIILLFTIWGFCDIIFFAIRFGVGPMPSSKIAIQKATEHVEKHHEIIYDIGGGFGRAAKYFALQFPNKNIIMIEISYFSCFIARLYCRRIPNIEIQRQNLLQYTFQENSYIYAYLYPSLMKELLGIFQNWNGRLVSYTFSLRNRREDNVVQISTYSTDKLYIYDFQKSM